jgi:hypothetical protein
MDTHRLDGVEESVAWLDIDAALKDAVDEAQEVLTPPDLAAIRPSW